MPKTNKSAATPADARATSDRQSAPSPCSCGLADDLASELDALKLDKRYQTVKLLKESPRERTELVVDEAGLRYVRKYLHLDAQEVCLFKRLAALDATHLARIREVLHYGDLIVVVSDYIDGRSLDEIVREDGPLPYARAQRYFKDICEALIALHTAQEGPIIHRDVNPSNIIVNERGAWLIDFGIARSYNKKASHDTRLWGTAGYAAPEQFGFAQTDERTDVYALGQTVRFMLTGAQPDEKTSAPQGAVKHVVRRACRIDPAKRYPDIAAFRRAFLGYAWPLQGLTKRSRAAKAAWVAWQTAAIFSATLVTVVMLCEVNALASSAEGQAIIAFAVFCVIVPLVLTTNFACCIDRIAWFSIYRMRKIIICICVSWLVFFVYVSLSGA